MERCPIVQMERFTMLLRKRIREKCHYFFCLRPLYHQSIPDMKDARSITIGYSLVREGKKVKNPSVESVSKTNRPRIDVNNTASASALDISILNAS